jgi:MFS family permease
MVSFAFLAVMAFSAVPSPLYGLYRARDHFSVFMVTVVYAVYAVGVIGALLLAGHLSDWYGRRRLLLPALGTAIASAIVFLTSKSLAGLLVGRLLNGVAIGIVVSTATAYLTELHAVGRPDASPRRAQLTASAIPVGGIGLGALLAGILAQWVAHPLAVPFLVFLAALLLGTIGIALSPETREGPKPRPRYRPQRVSVPHDERSTFVAAALSAFMAFATLGLFTGLASLFLAITLHHPSLALAGAVLGAVYASAVAAQILTTAWPVTREFEAGMTAMVTGLGLTVLAVWLRPPVPGAVHRRRRRDRRGRRHDLQGRGRDGHEHRAAGPNRRVAGGNVRRCVRGTVLAGGGCRDNALPPRQPEGHNPRLRDRRQRRHRRLRDQARGPHDPPGRGRTGSCWTGRRFS